MINPFKNLPRQFGADYSKKALKARRALRGDQQECVNVPVAPQKGLQAFANPSQPFATIRNLGGRLQSGFQIGLRGIVRNFRKIRNDPTPLKKKSDAKYWEGMDI